MTSGIVARTNDGELMTGMIDMKRKIYCLALGFAAFFAAMDLSGAATDETVRLVSADLRQTNLSDFSLKLSHDRRVDSERSGPRGDLFRG